MQSKKPNYTDELEKRAGKLITELTDAKQDQWPELVFNMLKTTALDSWKNGIQCGKKERQAETAQRS